MKLNSLQNTPWVAWITLCVIVKANAVISVTQIESPLVGTTHVKDTLNIATAHRQRVTSEVSVVAVAYAQDVSFLILDVASSRRRTLAERQLTIGTLPFNVTDDNKLTLILKLCLGIAMTYHIAYFHLNWVDFLKIGETIYLHVLFKLVKSHAASFPNTLSSIPFGLTNKVLTIVLTNPEVLHVDDDFLSQTVGVADAVGIDRDTNTCCLILDVEMLIDVTLFIATGDPAMDVGIFLTGVDKVSSILPVFCLEFGNCHVCLMLGVRHHHWWHVEVFVTSHSHKHEQQCIEE